MKWSYTVARVLGIDLKVHLTFALILAWGAAQWSGWGLEGMAFGVLLTLLLFLCVTLHEFGHAIAAQKFGIAVREIVLLPIGGMAVLAKNPSRPLHELVIAAAGPAVNVVIAVLLAIALAIKASLTGLDPAAIVEIGRQGPGLATALVWLLGANIALVLFNLIPALPMDGGRIFRGLLGLFLDWSKATRIAAVTGQVLAVGLAILALIGGNLVLLLIAVMVFMGAGSAGAEERARTVLSTQRVGDAYNKHALVLAEGDPVSKVSDYLLTSYQPDFAVMRGSELAGVVRRIDVLEALERETHDVPVVRIMQRRLPQVAPWMSLEQVQQALVDADCDVAAVFDGSRFLGLVNRDDLAEAMVILEFMRRGSATLPRVRRAPATPPPLPIRVPATGSWSHRRNADSVR